jgi:hypothetical protein
MNMGNNDQYPIEFGKKKARIVYRGIIVIINLRQYLCKLDKNPPSPDPRPRRVYIVFARHS